MKFLNLLIILSLNSGVLCAEENLNSKASIKKNAPAELRSIIANPDSEKQLLALNAKLSSLELITQRQDLVINSLNEKIRSYEDKPLEKNITYPIWTSIALGSAALLMTIVGIFIAVLSFIGYRQIVAKGVKRAEKVATKVAEEIANKTAITSLGNAVQESLDDLVDRGYFKPVVEELVERFMYRGIEIVDQSSPVAEQK